MSKCPFKPMQLVKATHTIGHGRRHLWSADEILLFLGEIKQMPGHVVVVTRDGKVHWGYYTENFVEPKESEI